MPKLVSRKKRVPTIPFDVVKGYVNEYMELSQQIKTLEARKKQIAVELKNYSAQNGTEDDKGSFYCENEDFVFGQVARTKLVQSENAIDILRELGREDCIKVEETIDREKLNAYHDEGIISDEDVKSLFEVVQESPSVMVKMKKKEEMPEIQTARVKKGK